VLLFDIRLEMHSVERGICPIATLYSLAAAYKWVDANRAQLSVTGLSVVNFVPKSVAMATGVGRGEI